ncbi:hypothetical protein QMK19_03235 [Streptomyces sp. H10-C2]|uniref:hypothetical protein n=1 Tax=Streptomyces sp. H10-C2 TaxID=3046210 RepID=UPI0024B9973D|nr:hypothetical protein [Streptomyces sp. H10-C2]MDJ0368713.1 hypothetical protein [Streptomyces sp. H10-C2]
MTESTARRTYLLAIVRNLGEEVGTKQALQIYAASQWAATSRNTARRDLRDLARRAYLVPVEHGGRRLYQVGSDPSPMHPGRGSRKSLLERIQAEGGEWTTGRIKRTWHQLLGTHVLRMAARNYLAALHRDGHLERHGDGTPRRYYTPRHEGSAVT